MLNAGCELEKVFQFEAVLVVPLSVVLEVIEVEEAGACTRSKTRKIAAMIMTMTRIMMEVFDFIIIYFRPTSQKHLTSCSS
jgi:hypothetical protein